MAPCRVVRVLMHPMTGQQGMQSMGARFPRLGCVAQAQRLGPQHIFGRRADCRRVNRTPSSVGTTHAML